MRYALAILAVAVVLPASASAQPSCGDTITTDTTLTQDLTGCHGLTALTVLGDTRLDLNHHAVSGDAAYGILAGHGSLTIQAGTVSGFGTGILLGQGADATISRLDAIGNGYGFDMAHARALFDRDTASWNAFDGFRAVTEPGSVVVASFSHNHADHNGALGIRGPFQTDLGHNKGRRNGDPRQCVGVSC